MKSWCRLAIESPNIGIVATKFVAQLSDAWAEDALLKDVELYFKRVNETTVEYVLSPSAGLIVRRSRVLEPFLSRLSELPEKPDLTTFRRVQLN